MEVELSAGAERNWIREVTERWGVRVRFEICRPAGSDLGELLQVVELSGDPGDLGAAERFLRHSPDIRALTVVSLSPSRRFLRVQSPLPEACRRIFEAGAVCGTCRYLRGPRPGGVDRWTLVVPRTPRALRAVARSGVDGNARVSPVVKMRRFVPRTALTPRQATALETACRLGFYAYPRRTNLQELARILGVSRPTVAELLRRAEARMLTPQMPES